MYVILFICVPVKHYLPKQVRVHDLAGSPLFADVAFDVFCSGVKNIIFLSAVIMTCVAFFCCYHCRKDIFCSL